MFSNCWKLGRAGHFGKKEDRELHSDSSTWAWAGLDLKSGRFVQDFWEERAQWNINVKDLEAAISTVMSLAQEKETVLLSVDNTVTYYYLTKGGRYPI